MPVAVCVNRLLTRFQETKVAELRSQFKRALAALLRKALLCYQHKLFRLQRYRYILLKFQICFQTNTSVCVTFHTCRVMITPQVDREMAPNVVKYCTAIKKRLQSYICK